MKIERVRVLETDDSLRLLQPARAIEIRTDRGITTTPGRCVTGYEFNRKAQVPASVEINNHVSVYWKRLTGGDIDSLLHSNDWFKSQVQSLEKAARITEYSVLHVPAFELARTSSTGPAPAEILQNERNRVLFLKQMIAVQQDAGYGIISIPPLGLPPGEAKPIMREADEAILKLGCQPLFSVDVRHGGFGELVDYLADDLQAPMINLRYGKRRYFSQHYLHLARLADKDVAFLMTGVARADSDHGELSTMHYMPFLGNDLFAVETPPPAISPSDKPKNIENLRALYRDELTILPVTDPRMSDLEVLDLEGNPVSEDLNLRLRNVREASRDAKKYSIINAITRIQELLGSSVEFSRLAGHVKERSSDAYVRGKRGLELRLQDM